VTAAGEQLSADRIAAEIHEFEENRRQLSGTLDSLIVGPADLPAFGEPISVDVERQRLVRGLGPSRD